MRLFSANERHLRAFLFSLVVDLDVVDELMQEVSTVLWKKFEELENDDGFLPWAFVIARYEVLMFRRKRARDRLVFDEGLLNMLAGEYSRDDRSEEDDALRQSLKGCVQRLEQPDRKLLAVAYGHGTQITELASHMGRTANSLYKSLGRLRRRLKHCIEREMGETI